MVASSTMVGSRREKKALIDGSERDEVTEVAHLALARRHTRRFRVGRRRGGEAFATGERRNDVYESNVQNS